MLAGDWSSFGQSLLYALKETIENQQEQAESVPPALGRLRSKISQGGRSTGKSKHEKVHLKVMVEQPLWSSSKGISREDDPLELHPKKENFKCPGF